MRRYLARLAFGVLCGAALVGMLDGPVAAAEPTVTSIIEARDPQDGRTALLIVGKGVSKFKSFALRTTEGWDLGEVELTAKSSTILAVRLPQTFSLGDFDLSLGFGKDGVQVHRVSLTNGTGVPPDSLTGAALNSGLRADLDDAAALGGFSPSVYARTANVLPLSGGTMSGPLTVQTSDIAVTGQSSGSDGRGVLGLATSASGVAIAVEGRSASSSGVGVSGHATSTSGSTFGVFGQSDAPDGAGVLAVMGGTGANSAALAVSHNGTSGAIAVFGANFVPKARIDLTGKGYFNGGTQASGADFAESVAVNRPASEFEPGDVVVIDVTGDRRFALASERESSLVAGVVSTKPAMLGSVHDVAGASPALATEIPLGIVGIVPTKVCDEGGAIRRGDLLVTSSVPGRAMRAPANPKVGTVLGKALGELASGNGVVEVLLVAR